MTIDKTTLNDLHIFNASGASVFSLIDYTVSAVGKEQLRKFIAHPPDSYEKLMAMQVAIKFWCSHLGQWQKAISNGTVVMLQQYYDNADVDDKPPGLLLSLFGGALLKLINPQGYYATSYSLKHFTDFFNGCRELLTLKNETDLPPLLSADLDAIQQELQDELILKIENISSSTSFATLANINCNVRKKLKSKIERLIMLFARQDALQSMARATLQLGWHFPVILQGGKMELTVEGLYHPLLQKPIQYNTIFDNKVPFLLLTGANMSGKSTYMRALCVAALLAHTGMGVPAQSMTVSRLQGIITNMQAEDNLLKGESYFMAEIKRIKHTATLLAQHQGYLVVLDELFKGTNVHDACECTKAVVEGLLGMPQHLLVLSTHLYEVATELKHHTNIQFAQFITTFTHNGEFIFTYRLENGISNDKIGYKMLLKEGVLSLLGNN